MLPSTVVHSVEGRLSRARPGHGAGQAAGRPQGRRSGYSRLVKTFKERFRIVKRLKPRASRDQSSETFLVAIGLKPAKAACPGTRNYSRHRPCLASETRFLLWSAW